MAIERNDILAKEEEDQKAEQERQQELQELRNKAHSDELARVKAEAELEAHRKMVAAPAQVQTQAWTEEQWGAAEQQTGMNRQQILASGQLANQVFETRSKELNDRLKAAEERAARAEDKANRYESKKGFESSVNEFYDVKPEYKSYKKEVNEFLEMFPESDRNDPDKIKKILGKAETYVKGMVGGKMRSQNSGNTGSARLSGGYIDDNQDEDTQVDFTGLENVGEKRLISDINSEFNSKEEKGDLDKYMSSDKLGIRLSSENEFKEAEAMLKRGSSFGGRKG
jgi:hypothetical protein